MPLSLVSMENAVMGGIWVHVRGKKAERLVGEGGSWGCCRGRSWWGCRVPRWRWASTRWLPALRCGCPSTVGWQGCGYQHPPLQRPLRGLPYPQEPPSLSPHHPKPDPAPLGPPRARHSPKHMSLEGTRVIFSSKAAVLIFLTCALLLERSGDVLLWGWGGLLGGCYGAGRQRLRATGMLMAALV